MEKPIEVSVTINIKPIGAYGEQVYTFQRTKTLLKSSQAEIGEMLEVIARQVAKETAALTTLQAILLRTRENQLEIKKEIEAAQIENKEEEVAF